MYKNILVHFYTFNPEPFRIAKFFAKFSFHNSASAFHSKESRKVISFTKNRLIFLIFIRYL